MLRKIDFGPGVTNCMGSNPTAAKIFLLFIFSLFSTFFHDVIPLMIHDKVTTLWGFQTPYILTNFVTLEVGGRRSSVARKARKTESRPSAFYELVIAFCVRQFCAEFCVTLTGHYRTNTGAILSFKRNVSSKFIGLSNGTIKLKNFQRFKHLN